MYRMVNSIIYLKVWARAWGGTQRICEFSALPDSCLTPKEGDHSAYRGIEIAPDSKASLCTSLQLLPLRSIVGKGDGGRQHPSRTSSIMMPRDSEFDFGFLNLLKWKKKKKKSTQIYTWARGPLLRTANPSPGPSFCWPVTSIYQAWWSNLSKNGNSTEVKFCRNMLGIWAF